MGARASGESEGSPLQRPGPFVRLADLISLRIWHTGLIYGHRQGVVVWRIEWAAPGAKDPGWRLAQPSWHKTRAGKPVVSNRRPRWRKVGTYASKWAALEAAEQAFGEILLDETRGTL